jgi:hypothetical protein
MEGGGGGGVFLECFRFASFFPFACAGTGGGVRSETRGGADGGGGGTTAAAGAVAGTEAGALACMTVPQFLQRIG